MQLVTHQTGPEGQLVRKVLIEEALQIARELYLAVTLDRAESKPVIIASAAGGMEIEEVAQKDPDAITRIHVDPHLGLLPFQGRTIARRLGLKGETAAKAAKLVAALVRAYRDRRLARRDQPAHDHRRGTSCARREDELRRQRPLPSPRHRRDA